MPEKSLPQRHTDAIQRLLLAYEAVRDLRHDHELCSVRDPIPKHNKTIGSMLGDVESSLWSNYHTLQNTLALAIQWRDEIAASAVPNAAPPTPRSPE